jgi:hypothetical protein
MTNARSPVAPSLAEGVVKTPDQALRQLRRLMRAYDRYARAARGPASSEARLDAEFERLVAILRGSGPEALDPFLVTARTELAQREGAVAELGASGEPVAAILRAETALLSGLGADLETIRRFLAAYPEAAGDPEFTVATTDDLIGRLRALHAAGKRQIAGSRLLSRHPKKRRKRQVAKAIASLVIGTGAFVTNANVPSLAATSYAFGLSALYQAVLALIGERRD